MHDGQVEEPRLCRQMGDVTHPQPIRRTGSLARTRRSAVWRSTGRSSFSARRGLAQTKGPASRRCANWPMCHQGTGRRQELLGRADRVAGDLGRVVGHVGAAPAPGLAGMRPNEFALPVAAPQLAHTGVRLLWRLVCGQQTGVQGA